MSTTNTRTNAATQRMPGLAKNYFKSVVEGARAEFTFEELVIRHGMKYNPASQYVDIHKHIDCVVETKDGSTFSCDIKACKRPHRYAKLDPTIQWIEFSNVQGKDGWLYGEADYIVFDALDRFHLVHRESLVDYSVSKCSIEEQQNPAPMPKLAERVPYRAYGRPDRKDSIMIVEMEDLLANTRHMTWLKTEENPAR